MNSTQTEYLCQCGDWHSYADEPPACVREQAAIDAQRERERNDGVMDMTYRELELQDYFGVDE